MVGRCAKVPRGERMHDRGTESCGLQRVFANGFALGRDIKTSVQTFCLSFPFLSFSQIVFVSDTSRHN